MAVGRRPRLRSVASATSVRAAFIDDVTILIRDYEPVGITAITEFVAKTEAGESITLNVR